jgi:phosphate transport system ATP-binding protein
MMPETKIRIKNLKVFFGHQEVLTGVDLDVYKDRVLGLMGPSASGKSSFISVLNGMIHFEDGGRFQGDVYIEGFGSLSGRSNGVALRKTVGTVFASN